MSNVPKRHGNLAIGRALVALSCVLAAGANWVIYRSALRRPHPLDLVEVAVALIFLWMVAGSVALCLRTGWARYFTLLITTQASVGFLLGGILVVITHDQDYVGLTYRLFAASAVYFIVTMILVYSRHVRRLTSRAWE